MTLTASLQQQILEHAKAEDPREACGLIAVVKGRRRYFACKNLADTPDEHFVLDPADYTEVEDQGEIVAVVHSHPISAPIPSQADRVACERSGLPWYIVNPKAETFGYCEPVGYKAPLVGREFVFGILDCYTLCQDWYAENMGLTLSDYERRDKFWERGENLYLDNFHNENFRVVPFDTLQPGDAILMQLQSPLPNHAAVYLGDQQIIHHVQGRLSSRDVFGGYYVKNTAKVLRHESR